MNTYQLLNLSAVCSLKFTLKPFMIFTLWINLKLLLSPSGLFVYRKFIGVRLVGLAAPMPVPVGPVVPVGLFVVLFGLVV